MRHQTSRKRVVPFLAGSGATEPGDESLVTQEGLTELGEVGFLNRLDQVAELPELLGRVPRRSG